MKIRSMDRIKADRVFIIVAGLLAGLLLISGGLYLAWEFTKLLALIVVSTSDEVLMFGVIFAITAFALAAWEHHESGDTGKVIAELLGAFGTLIFASILWFVIDLAIRVHQGR